MSLPTQVCGAERPAERRQRGSGQPHRAAQAGDGAPLPVFCEVAALSTALLEVFLVALKNENGEKGEKKTDRFN